MAEITDAKYTLSDMMNKIINEKMAIETAQDWAQSEMMDSYSKFVKKRSARSSRIAGGRAVAAGDGGDPVAEAQATFRRRPPASARSSAARRVLGRDWLLGWLLVGPVFLIVLALLIYPFIDAIVLSFQERLIGKTGTWVGLQNYTDFFTNPDSQFLKAAWITLVFTGGGDRRQVHHRHGDGVRAEPGHPPPQHLPRADVPALGGAGRRDRLRLALPVRHLRPDQRPRSPSSGCARRLHLLLQRRASWRCPP